MRLVFAALSVFILLIVGLLIGPSFVDWNSYKPQIIEQIKKASGYDVTIGGDLKMAILPTPSVTINQVSVEAPKKVESATLVSVEKAHVSLALMPLFKKEVQVSAVELVKPDITLEVLKDGSQGWMSDTLNKASDVKQALPETAQQEASNVASGAAEKISLDSVEIEDGKITYIDHAKGSRQALENINLALSAPSLKGPFKAKGDFVHQGRTIEIDGKTGRFEKGADNISVNADIALPGSKTKLSFNGVAAIGETPEVQGETDFKTANLAALAPASGIAKPASFSGMLSANQDEVFLTDADISLGELKGSGKMRLSGLKERKPMKFGGSIKLDGILNLEDVKSDLAPSKAPSVKDAEKAVAKGGSTAKSGGFLPQTLTLPGALEGQFTIEAGGVEFGGQAFKGLLLDVAKKGKVIAVDVKVLDMPGQGKTETKGVLEFVSSSTSAKDGSVTLSDPSLKFQSSGSIGQLDTFISALAPDQKNNDAVKAFKTLQYNASGAVKPSMIEVSKSSVKLDQTNAAIAGSYKPSLSGAKADVTLDISADTIDLDSVMVRMGQKKATSPAQTTQGQAPAAPAAKADLEKSLEPVRDFELPVNLAFDLSLQKLRYNTQDIEGIRLKGKSVGSSLVLDAASANKVMGGNVSAKGKVGDLKKLSGIDLDLYGKTENADQLMKTLNVDLSKLPSKIGVAEAKLTIKGAAEELVFTSNISALRGQFDATGTVKNALSDSRDINASAIGFKHPDIVQAIQIFNPSFQGPVGLKGKAVDFYTAMAVQGKTYNFTGVKAKIGPTSITGDVKADLSGARPSLSGDVNLGSLALDVLLTGSKVKSSEGKIARTSASKSSKSSNGSARWSRNAIDTGWMRSADLDFGIKGERITYGAWAFTNPNTKLTMKNGTVKVDNLNAGLFGGKAGLNATVVAPADPKQPITMAVDSKMTDVQIEQLAKALSGSGKLQGRGDVSLDMDVTTAGISPSALINSLKGKADLDGKNIVLEGFDFAKLARGLATEEKLIDSASSFIDGVTSGGETQFDTLTGDYNITEGIVKIIRMQMDGPAAVVNSTGNVNLPAYTIDTTHLISLKQVQNLEPFKITINGPLDNPSTVGMNVIEQYLQKKLERKIVKELPKLLGDDVNQKLQQFGILPKEQQAPAPAQETAPAAGQETQQQKQPQQQPTAEDAIKGVLEGLLR